MSDELRDAIAEALEDARNERVEVKRLVGIVQDLANADMMATLVALDATHCPICGCVLDRHVTGHTETLSHDRDPLRPCAWVRAVQWVGAQVTA